MSTPKITIKDLIPEGHENRVGRRYLVQKAVAYGLINEACKDKERALRKLVHECQMDGVFICNAGDGYFLPTPGDVQCLRHDILRDEMAARSMLATLTRKKALLADYEAGRIK